MIIVNNSKGVTIANRGMLAVRVRERMIGLMGRNRLDEGEALVLRPCNGVHTVFMRFPIDVIFLDKHGSVVKLLRDFAPYRFSPLVLNSSMVIELPSGTIERSGTDLADLVELRN